LFSLNLKAQTSVYHSFPDSAAVWNIHYSVHSPLFWPDVSEDYSFIISGDTLINSQTYHKLIIPYLQINTPGNCDVFFLGYQGAIRQDTLNKKEFIISPYDSLEQLLYDFNLQIGDSVRGFLETPFSGDIVQSMDSVLIGNDYRKRWVLSGAYIDNIIEGIGSTYSVAQAPLPPFPHSGFECPVQLSLSCFSQNGETLYPNTIGNCQVINSIPNPSQNTFHSIVYPNPFHSFAALNLSLEFENIELTIYNALGEIVAQQKITNHSSIIKRDKLDDGIYFYQLISNKGKVTTGKLMIE